MTISQWSSTPANNASGVTGVNWAEGQAPSTVNDSARQMMADVAVWYAQLVGAAVVFQQTAAPTGWTKVTTHNDKALRVVSGTAGSGGATAFTTVFGSGLTTGSHVLTTAEMPSHTHTVAAQVSTSGSGIATKQGITDNATITTGSTGSDGGHTHTLSMDILYVDCIIATKDS